MRRRVPAGPGVREREMVRLRRLIGRYEHIVGPTPWKAQLTRMERGLPVVEQGWVLGFGALDYSHYVLEPDGRVTPCEPVYVQGTRVPTVCHYVRPDGSMVRECGRNHDGAAIVRLQRRLPRFDATGGLGDA